MNAAKIDAQARYEKAVCVVLLPRLMNFRAATASAMIMPISIISLVGLPLGTCGHSIGNELLKNATVTMIANVYARNPVSIMLDSVRRILRSFGMYAAIIRETAIVSPLIMWKNEPVRESAMSKKSNSCVHVTICAKVSNPVERKAVAMNMA